jgi:iduronate 2-sulfatase
VEQKIIKQQGDKWDRELFEKHLMGYTIRTDRYRLVSWRDYRDRAAPPVSVELYDHKTDPGETKNVADDFPDVAKRLSAQLMDQVEKSKRESVESK